VSVIDFLTEFCENTVPVTEAVAIRILRWFGCSKHSHGNGKFWAVEEGLEEERHTPLGWRKTQLCVISQFHVEHMLQHIKKIAKVICRQSCKGREFTSLTLLVSV